MVQATEGGFEPKLAAMVQSLVAAAAPASVPYFYFVSRNDGSHVFSRTEAEHLENFNRCGGVITSP